MQKIFNIKSILILLSAFILSVFVILPIGQNFSPFAIIYSGFRIADTLFHELGHSIFHWFFGSPAIPAILTLFGADQAGGVSLTFDRSWIIQIFAYFVMAYIGFWIWRNANIFFIPILILFLAIVILSFTRYYNVIPIFMGHGGSVCMGAFFIFRAVLYIGPRKIYERWLNAFFGFFLTLNNIFFSYKLITDKYFLADYSTQTPFGGGHHDLFSLTEEAYGWTVTGVAEFLMFFGIFAIVIAIILPVFLKDYFYTNLDLTNYK